MAYAGTLTYKTELDTNGVKKSGSIIKGIVAGLGITKLISTAMNTIKNSTSDAIKRLDTFNQYPKVLANFGVSANEASKSIKRIDESTRGLPIALDRSVAGVQNLFMVTKDLPKAEKLFKAMTDSAMVFAGGSTEAIDRFSYAFKQAMSAGKVSAQDFNQMNEAIPGLMDKVAESMGMTYKQLKDGLSDGSVSMDQFNDALLKLDKEGGAGMKALEQSAKDATGGIQTSIANMKTAIVRGLTEVIKKIDESLKAYGGLSGVISSFGQVASEILMKVGNILASVLPKLISMAQWMMRNKAIVLTFITPVISLVVAFKSLTGIASMLVGISKGIETMQKAMAFVKTIPTLLSSVKTAFMGLNASLLASPVFWVVAGVVALIAGLVILYNKCDSFKKLVDGIFSDIKEMFMNVYNSIKPQIDDFMKSVGKAIREIVKALSNAWQQIKPAIQQLMTALGQLFKALEPVVKVILDLAIKRLQWIIQLFAFLIPIIANIVTFIINVVTPVITFVVNVITTIINAIKTVVDAITWLVTHIQEIPGIIINFIGQIPTYIGYVIGFIIGLIVKLVARLVQFITTDIPNFINGVVQWFAQLPGRIWTWLTQLPSKIGQAINNMVSKAKTTIPNVVNAIVNGLGKAISKVADVGKNIVKGLWNGIKGMKDWVIDKIKGFGKGLVNGLKKALGIKSPSKVMADQVGQWIPKGIAVGIDMNLNSIDKSLEDMYKEMNNTVRMENAKLGFDVISGNVYNKALYQTPVAIDLNADVEMDNQKVGRLVTPSVVKTIKTGGGSL